MSRKRSPQQRHRETAKLDLTHFINSFEPQQKYDLTTSYAEDKEMYIKDEKTISKDPLGVQQMNQQEKCEVPYENQPPKSVRSSKSPVNEIKDATVVSRTTKNQASLAAEPKSSE